MNELCEIDNLVERAQGTGLSALQARALATEMARLYVAAGEPVPPRLRCFLPQPEPWENEK